MYTLICGSAKRKDSNSLYFLKAISEKMNNYNLFELCKDNYDDIQNSIRESDTIVFSFPLYVDSPNSVTLSFLDYIVDNKIRLDDKLVYVIINCGFREGEQNITALNVIKCWCGKVGATYGSALLIGAGEIVGKPKFRFIANNVFRNLKIFSKTIEEKRKDDDIITTIDLIHSKLYCYIANVFWNRRGKKNNLSKSELWVK